jgi:hypothetical protein
VAATTRGEEPWGVPTPASVTIDSGVPGFDSDGDSSSPLLGSPGGTASPGGPTKAARSAPFASTEDNRLCRSGIGGGACLCRFPSEESTNVPEAVRVLGQTPGGGGGRDVEEGRYACALCCMVPGPHVSRAGTVGGEVCAPWWRPRAPNGGVVGEEVRDFVGREEGDPVAGRLDQRQGLEVPRLLRDLGDRAQGRVPLVVVGMARTRERERPAPGGAARGRGLKRASTPPTPEAVRHPSGVA